MKETKEKKYPLHLSISDKTIDCAIERKPLTSLRLDPQNPRFSHLKNTLADAEMEREIWEENDTKQLYKSILQSRGLSELPFVHANGRIAEGNRRIVCLRKLRELVKRGKIPGISADAFDFVECIVLPSNMPEQELAVFLGRVHVTGKKEWKALNQAKYIYDLRESFGLPSEEIAGYLAISKANIEKKYWAYKKTVEFLERFPQKANVEDFSFFEEAHKKRGIRDWMEKDEANLQKFFTWVAQKNLKRALDVRELPKILAQQDISEEFERNGIEKALLELAKISPSNGSKTFAAIENAVSALRNIPRNEYLGISQSDKQRGLLTELQQEIGKIFNELEIGRQ